MPFRKNSIQTKSLWGRKSETQCFCKLARRLPDQPSRTGDDTISMILISSNMINER